MGVERLYLLDRPLVDTTTFVDEMTGCSGLARIDVADNDTAHKKSVRTRLKKREKREIVETERGDGGQKGGRTH
jgi:hypothetical protein